MKSLLIKDIYNLKQQGKIYLILIGFWLMFSILYKEDYLFSGVMMIFTVLIPINSMAYDEKANFYKYSLTMPVSRTDIVASKYLLSLICALFSIVISAAIGAVLSKNPTESILTSVTSMSIGITLAALILPFIFKLGVEKGRLIMIVLFLVPTAVIMFFSNTTIKPPSEEVVMQWMHLSPVIALAVIAISFFISTRIFNSLEF